LWTPTSCTVYQADIVIVDTHKLHSVPVFDPVSTLVYSSNGSDVDTVIVGGKVLMEHRDLISWDVGEILDSAQRAAVELKARTGS